jgi:hypothetical protein
MNKEVMPNMSSILPGELVVSNVKSQVSNFEATVEAPLSPFSLASIIFRLATENQIQNFLAALGPQI